MNKTALLIIDVQNDFCSGGTLAVASGDEVVKPLNRMIQYARKNKWVIIVSRDWHPKETTHFDKWPTHCVQNTLGAEFHPDLLNKGAVIVSKGTLPNEDDYSAFSGTTKDGKTLEEFLKDNNVERIYVGGLAIDYCVKATVMDALDKDFKTYLLTDACRGVDPKMTRRALFQMWERGVNITYTTNFK